MLNRFAAAQLKIERANKHIADLEAIIAPLPDAYTSVVETNAGGGESIKYLAPNIPKLAATIALLTGDAVHNLRVAIEYAYLGAVEKHAPSVLDRYTKFPTGQTRKEVEDALKNRKIDVHCPELFNRIVSNIKPYIDDGHCLVRFIHQLDVSDKHWLLIPLLRTSWVSDIVVQNEKGEIITGESHSIPGEETFFFDFRPGWKVKDKGKITVEVVFNDFDLLKGMPILSDLKDFSKMAHHVVDTLDSI